MTASSLVIVADRGSVRAYRVEETPTRGSSLKLIQAFDITDPDAASACVHIAPRTDWPELGRETDRRVCAYLADRIAQIVACNPGEGWSFAAPGAIYSEIVRLLPVEIRERMLEHVDSDLVKTPGAKLAGHFQSLQPI